MARTDVRCSIQSPSLVAQISSSKISTISMYDNQNVERLPFPPLRNLMYTPNSSMIHVYEPSQGPDSGMLALCLHKSCI